MNKPARLAALLLTLPFLAGCFTVATVPVPRTQPERESLTLQGFVVTDGTTEEVVRYDEVLEARWTQSSLSIVGATGSGEELVTETRLIPITELRGLLIRTLDAGSTSAIIGGVIVGAAAAIAVLVTGKAGDYRIG